MGLPYERAMTHINQCELKELPCEQGCGMNMLKAKMADHRKQCVNYEELCERCESVYRPNEPSADGASAKHDCIEQLKKRHARMKVE